MTDLPAGRELDTAVAKALGWSVVVPDFQEDWYDRQVTSWPCLIMREEGGYFLDREENLDDWEIWRPSTDTAAAIEALEAWCNAGDDRIWEAYRLEADHYYVNLEAADLCQAEGYAPTLAHAAAKALVTASAATP